MLNGAEGFSVLLITLLVLPRLSPKAASVQIGNPTIRVGPSVVNPVTNKMVFVRPTFGTCGDPIHSTTVLPNGAKSPSNCSLACPPGRDYQKDGIKGTYVQKFYSKGESLTTWQPGCDASSIGVTTTTTPYPEPTGPIGTGSTGYTGPTGPVYRRKRVVAPNPTATNKCFGIEALGQFNTNVTILVNIKPNQTAGQRGTILWDGNLGSLDLQDGHLRYTQPQYGYATILDNLNIDNNAWTTIAMQIQHPIYQNPYVSIFVNGTFIPPVQEQIPGYSKRKRRQFTTTTTGSSIYVGLNPSPFSSSSSVEVLEIEACRQIGFSVAVVPLYSSAYKEYNSSQGLPNIPDLSTQSGVAANIFSAPSSLFKCNYDTYLQQLFACSYYLPPITANSVPIRPCSTFCTEIMNKCGTQFMSLLGMDTNCTNFTYYFTSNERSPLSALCVDGDFVADYGSLNAEVKNVEIYNTILTNREIEALYNNLTVLPPVRGLSNCLCPTNSPAISMFDDFMCVSNQYFNDTGPIYGHYTSRLSQNSSYNYHLPEYVNDGDINTAWYSAPSLMDVSVAILFDQPYQVLGVELYASEQLPTVTTTGQYGMSVELLKYNQWQVVHYLDAVKCTEDQFITTPDQVICNNSNQILQPIYGQQQIPPSQYIVDLMDGRTQWNYSSHMDPRLVVFLWAQGVRIHYYNVTFSPNLGAPVSRQFNALNEVKVLARLYSGRVLCNCSSDGTNISGTCAAGGQCPCDQTRGDPTQAGKQCNPYISNTYPAMGPYFGGTTLVLRGGYLGTNATVQLNNLECNVSFSNDTLIICTTPNIHNLTDVNGTLNITVFLLTGYVINTGHTFSYLPDPTVSDVYPLQTFLMGGIRQTVIGDNFNSVAVPLLMVTLVYEGKKYPQDLSPCDVQNNTCMYCPSPTFTNLPPHLQDPQTSRKKRAAPDDRPMSLSTIWSSLRHLLSRQKRDVPYYNQPDQEFYIGIILDGVPTYHNVTNALGVEKGIIKVSKGHPTINLFDPLVKIFCPYKGDKFLIISGDKMNFGCALSDYNVTIGQGGVCKGVELLTNQYTCQPPLSQPAVGLLSSHGAPRILVSVGNIVNTVGYLKYSTLWLDNKDIILPIVIIGGFLIITGIIVWICLKKKYGQPIKVLREWRATEKERKKNKYLTTFGSTSAGDSVKLFKIPDDLDEDLKLRVQECLIDSNRLILGAELGKGNFGKVYSGQFVDSSTPSNLQDVAVKVLHDKQATFTDISEFLEEAIIMKDFENEHVLKLLGIVIIDNIPHVVLPLMENGSLKDFVSDSNHRFTVMNLLEFGIQVAQGMAYLAQQKFVHRDLAARNCMVDIKQVVKIADFGLARDIYEKEYYKVEDKRRPLPIKWMAIECLESFKFTIKSDVWAFGVTLWELITRGTRPYADVDNMEMKRFLIRGNRLQQPFYCPDRVYEVMVACWSHDPEDRPEFSQIVRDLTNFVQETEETLNEHNAHTKQDAPHDYIELHKLQRQKTDSGNYNYFALSAEVPADPRITHPDDYIREKKKRYTKEPTKNTTLEDPRGYLVPATEHYSGLQPSKQDDKYLGIQASGDKQSSDQPTDSEGYLQPATVATDAHRKPPAVRPRVKHTTVNIHGDSSAPLLA